MPHPKVVDFPHKSELFFNSRHTKPYVRVFPQHTQFPKICAGLV